METTAAARGVRRLLPVALAVLVYGAAVSRAVQRAALAGDLRGCVEVHALQDQGLLVAGLLAGLACGPWALGWGQRLARAFFPQEEARRRTVRLRWAAGVILLVGALSNVLWVGAPVNVFVDLHRGLLVETELLLFGMGVLQGAGWYTLLDRDAPWLALPLMPAMALMLIATGVVGRGWC